MTPTTEQRTATLPPRRFCVAPMMDCTDRFDRALLRLISRRAWLYTEMVTTGAVLHGDRDRLLRFDAMEHPVALQLGGADPGELAACAAIAADWGYDEVNLNVGCPSDRVQAGRFGASLMAEPGLVADCVAAMAAAGPLPVTVKCRIGIDEQDPAEALPRFVETVSRAGCRTFIVHARKAWLAGLSPKQNRDVPPLDYPLVDALKADRPDLEILLNGGLTDMAEAARALDRLDGVMVGREAYRNPYSLAVVDRLFFGDDRPVRSRAQVLADYLPLIAAWTAEGVPLKHVTRHLVGLFQGLPGARAWRRAIAEQAHLPDANIAFLEAAARQVRDAA